MELTDYITLISNNSANNELTEKSENLKIRLEPVVGFKLTNIQIAQLLMFYDMIIEKNKVMNLTAITVFEEFIVKHYVDCLEIKRIFNLSSDEIKILDVGTGAGFPGIPLKIIYPNLDITLFDSLQKRLIFLDEVISKLNLKKIQTVHGRAEEFGRKLEYREKYDIVVSRAVAGLNTLCEITLPFCKVGGYFIAYKGGKGDEELKVAERCIKELNGRVDASVKYELSLSDEKNDRILIKIKKFRPTNSKYPRGGGKPFKTPLYIDN